MFRSLATFAAAGLAIYFIVSLIYNVYLHPLAKFPGPPAWTASRFPFVISLVTGRLPHDYRRFHDQYGPVIRVAPNELSFIEPAAWRDIYTKPNLIRPLVWRGKPPGFTADNLISASETDHKRFRKILAPAFSEQAIKRQEPIINNYVDLFISKLKEQSSSSSDVVLDVVEWFNYASFDIIGDLSWGSSFACLDNKKVNGWIQVVLHFKAVVIAASFKYFPPLDAILDAITPREALKDIYMVVDTARQKVAQRLATKTDRPDLVGYITAQSDPDLRMTTGEMELNLFAIIVAGSESVTTILTAIVNCLLADADQYARVSTEIRSSFTSETEITGVSTAQLPYLNAVLKEGMRIAPSIPDGSRRDIPAGETAIIAGDAVPGPTTVAVPQWSAYQAARNFTNAQVFAPERWLAGSSEELYGKDRKDIFQPFGYGAHNCPGQPLAWLEMRLILARLLFAFDLSLPKTTTTPLNWSSQEIYWTWVKEPLKVKIEPRHG